ncbi:MAG: GLPGLI family protein, partial [Bacteroidetes bacterium]|nr:GLPGLI family protein [Bacteroidota bacterium]
MTKKIHFIIFVFMISCIKSQYIKVQYKFTYLTESNNLNSKKEELMTLVTNNKKSIYFSEDKLIGDSLKIQDSKTLTLPEIIANKNKYKTNSSSIVVIKDFDKNNLTFYNKIVKTYFTYTQKINSIDWTITQEIKKFENYILKKAIGNFGGREYTVWYCPEIQIPDGPYKFTGLPG